MSHRKVAGWCNGIVGLGVFGCSKMFLLLKAHFAQANPVAPTPPEGGGVNIIKNMVLTSYDSIHHLHAALSRPDQHTTAPQIPSCCMSCCHEVLTEQGAIRRVRRYGTTPSRVTQRPFVVLGFQCLGDSGTEESLWCPPPVRSRDHVQRLDLLCSLPSHPPTPTAMRGTGFRK